MQSHKVIYQKPVFFLVFILVAFSLYAAPHRGDYFQLQQPDKSRVTVRVWGDEFYQDVEGIDGYTLVRDSSSGWICYAELSSEGNEYLSTGIIYRLFIPENDSSAMPGTGTSFMKQGTQGLEQHLRINQQSMQKKAFDNKQILTQAAISTNEPPRIALDFQPAPPKTKSLSGTITGLTLLVDFPDQKALVTKNQVQAFCNQEGYSSRYANGSVRDWFYEVSNGKLIYENIVTDVITVSKVKSYYDANCEYCKVPELINEALTKLRESGFDFSPLSTKDGYFTAINVLYAGEPSMGWAKGLWPHQGWLNGSFSVNGIKARVYQLTDLGDSFSTELFTFTHENGHMVCGWDDLYAYDNHDKGLGYWDSGSNRSNPSIPNPYFLHLLDWIDVTDITGLVNGSFDLVSNSRQACMYHGGNNEVFYLESVRRSGRNANLPGEGMLIWHVYTEGKNTYSNETNLVSLEQADGRFDLENSANNGDANDSFRAGYRDSFNDSTRPSATWYTKQASGLDVNSISAVGDIMSFKIGTGGPLIETGDVNEDAVVNILDALLIAQFYVNLEPENFNPRFADVNNDGGITIVDALLIARFYVGLIPGF
ncbi:MAG: M6 family metalloprotease domain-containing protein [Spirochaetales bacterium]|nr:M6 family metalloprotease domain-containing protein [Spirochaetales bacterium]